MSSSTPTATREITYAEAVREALAEEMRRDPTVFILGEDVAETGTPFKVLSGLVEEFGTERVLDTPISEAGFCGLGVGAAMTGLRPVVDITFGDFSTLVIDQMANQAAKVHYMSGGHWKVPMVMRTTLGAIRRSAAQHSQSLHAWFSHVPGLKVVLPSTPYDAKGLLKTAIRDDNPVVFFEDKMMYKLKGPVPEEEYTIPVGVADIKRVGADITFIATSSMVQVALGAAAMLEDVGISAEVVDPRTTWPLDEATLVESVKKTSRAIVLDEGYARYGVTAELASVVMEGAFYHLDKPVRRMGARHVPIPFSPPLETFWPAKDGWSAARIEEEIVVTEKGHEVITRFPAEKLMVAGAHYVTVDGPLPTTREHEAAPSQTVLDMIDESAKREGVTV
jgi:acetoin:2,6-dichlorophenolindophenol oxidoreductase subunit beta